MYPQSRPRIIGSCRNGQSKVYNTLQDALRDDLLSLSLSACSESLDWLPPKLQVFTAHHCYFQELPRLPTSLRELSVTTCKLEIFPVIEHCNELEAVNLFDCYIERVDTKFPDNLKSVDISFNKLREFDGTVVNRDLIELNVSYNFLTELNLRDLKNCNVTSDHNNFPDMYARKMQLKLDGSGKKESGHGIYDNAENVHRKSIQKSVEDAVTVIMALCPDKRYNKHFVKEILRTYRGGCLCCSTQSAYVKPPLEFWTGDEQVFTRHAVTYGQLLERVWAYIKSSKTRKQLVSILQEELDASKGLCFTGVFSRTASVLHGFVPGINIRISEGEQIQERISAAVKRCREKYGEDNDCFVRTAKLAVLDILSEHNVDHREHDAWLDAIE